MTDVSSNQETSVEKIQKKELNEHKGEKKTTR